MGAMGIFIALIVNMFLQNSMMDFVISCVGVVVFTGLTAYDVQKIKTMGSHVSEHSEDFRRYSILGALRLYLDFINLFIMLLRLMGSRD